MQHLTNLAYMVVGAFLFWLGYYSALPVRKPATPRDKRKFKILPKIEPQPKKLTDDEEKAHKFYS